MLPRTFRGPKIHCVKRFRITFINLPHTISPPSLFEIIGVVLINNAFDKKNLRFRCYNLNSKVSFTWKMSTANIIVYQLQTNSNIDYASLNRNSVHISSCDVSHLQALCKSNIFVWISVI